MPIDFAARVDDLCDYLAKEYRITDRAAIEILISAQLPIEGIPHPWVILETDWRMAECRDAWFSFGETWNVKALSMLRASRPRSFDSIMHADSQQRPRLFVECHYQTQPPIRAVVTGKYRALCGLCVRVRTTLPRSNANLNLNPAAVMRKRLELKRLAFLCIDSQFRGPVPEIVPPQDFLYQCEIAFKLTAAMPWEMLINRVAHAVLRRAYLYDRPVDSSDWAIAGRLLADLIPYWTLQLIEYCGQTEESGGFARDKAVAAVTGFERYKGTRGESRLRAAHEHAIQEKVLLHRYSSEASGWIWKVLHPDVYRVAEGDAFTRTAPGVL